MNTFISHLREEMDYTYTENGALTHSTTNSELYDLFAFGAAYRSRTPSDCIMLFKNAFEENETYAMKCLFWIRDCRGGAGERRFFRICIKWLAKNHPEAIKRNLSLIPEFGRYDDWLELLDTPLKKDVIHLIAKQLINDMTCEENGISLLAKWLPSENASSPRTKARARDLKNSLHLTSKDYRQMLSKLRGKINVLERLMSANEWDKIKFDKIPSKAGIIYKNAFARRDVIAEKYAAFAKNKYTKVNANVLYPYEVVSKAIKNRYSKYDDETTRAVINKYWENLPNYFEDKPCSIMCVVDTSGSMRWGSANINPIDVAIGLGMYCAERIEGNFKNYYISFASRPQLIKINGIDFVDKVKRIYETNLCDSTNLTATFNLLLKTILKYNLSKDEIPKTLVIISDMEIDDAGHFYWEDGDATLLTEMENIRKRWESYGLKMPRLIYWNVNARNNRILDKGPDVSYVSGASPSVFKQIITGKNGYDLMLETILNDRYKDIK